jgi:hypothetical protein
MNIAMNKNNAYVKLGDVELLLRKHADCLLHKGFRGWNGDWGEGWQDDDEDDDDSDD